MVSLNQKFDVVRNLTHPYLSSVLDLIIRVWMGKIFLTSGWLKFSNFLNNDWSATVYLFEEAHPIPSVSPAIAAVTGTAGEIGLSVLLILGLFGRFAALGLLVMTCVIQFVVPASYEVSNPIHFYWMAFFAMIMFRGSGLLSLDALIARFLK